MRASLAGEASASAKRQAATKIGYYNVKLGDLQMRTYARAEVEFNDNVELTDSNAHSDVIFRPEGGGRFDYPVTENNTLNLAIGVGYSYYHQQDELNRYFITPGSELSFDIYAGDCVINLHDRFSVTQDSYQNLAATGAGNVGTMENTSGFSTTWDLNELLLVGGYDYMIRKSTSSGISVQDANSHTLFGQAGVRPNDFTTVGVEAGLSFIDRDVYSSGNQYNAGLFYRGQISSYLSLQAGLGYVLFDFDRSTLTTGEDKFTGYYGNLGFQHRVNEILSYTVSAGRDLQLGLYSTGLDYFYARWNGNWNLIREVGLGTHFEYEWGNELGGAADDLSRWMLGCTVGRSITQKLGAQLAYDWEKRDANVTNRGYIQNRITLRLNYTF